MIIDTHTHVYPAKIAEKAVMGVGNFYGLPMKGNGTPEGLLECADSANVDKCLICSVATNAEQVNSINNFIAKTVAEHPDRFIGFGTIFPDAEDTEEQVEALIERGLQGIKLHPDFQKFNADSENAMKLYEYVNGRVPILFHAGDYRTDYSSPERFLNISKKYPELGMILAHFGGWSIWGKQAEELAKCDNIYVDSSSSLQMAPLDLIVKLIKLYGSEKIFFGSDFPMWKAEDELKILEKLQLTDTEMDNIMHHSFENFAKCYGIKIQY